MITPIPIRGISSSVLFSKGYVALPLLYLFFFSFLTYLLAARRERVYYTLCVVLSE